MTPWSCDANVDAVLANLRDGFLKRYIAFVRDTTDAPLFFHIACASSALSAVLPQHWEVDDVPGDPVNGIIFSMLVGQQGTDRKTTAINKAGKMLEEAAPGRRLSSPGSVEALVDDLAKSEGLPCLWVHEEMGNFWSSTKSRGGGNYREAIKTQLLSVYDGSVVERKLARKKLIRCAKPRMSLLGGVNAPLLCQYTDDVDHQGGLMSRIMMFMATRERHSFNPGKGDLAQRQWLVDWLGYAAKMPLAAWGAYGGMTPLARTHWVALALAIEATKPEGAQSKICGARARTPVMAIKLAMLFAFSEGAGWPSGSNGVPNIWMIEEHHMIAAIQFAEMCYVGALTIANTVTGSKDMRDRAQVLECVKEEWTPMSTIIRGSQQLKKRVGDILDSLIAERTIERQMVLDASGELFYRRALGMGVTDGADLAMRSASEIDIERNRLLREGFPEGSEANLALPAPAPVADTGITTEVGAPALDDLFRKH